MAKLISGVGEGSSQHSARICGLIICNVRLDEEKPRRVDQLPQSLTCIMEERVAADRNAIELRK